MRKYLEEAKAAAREAGEWLKAEFAGGRAHYRLKGPKDLVTAADLAAQELIRGRLEGLDAAIPFLGEEGGQGTDGWVVDPLDGTTNFAHGYPHFAVSIALTGRLAVVYDPMRDELFEACEGEARCNGALLRASECASLSQALLATGFAPEPPRQFEIFERLEGLSLGVRRDSCASLDLCYVAAGRLDGFWERDLKPWDVAAGRLILAAAGARLTQYNPGDYLASNANLHEELLRHVRF